MELKLTKYDVKLDFMTDLCEGCGEYKRTVICFRKPNMITDILKYFDEKKENNKKRREV